MLLHTWGLPDRLRAADLTVVETSGWTTRTHGNLPDAPTVVWHHDASPVGDSPGALDWMLSNWDKASAQVWIDRYGRVHLIGTGVAWHAGAVLPEQRAYDNFRSIGIETDHTTGEDWPDEQLKALRLTTAVILDAGRRDRTDFSFHRVICSPPGRKSDPAGLDLDTERRAVRRIRTDGGVPVSPPSPPAPVVIPDGLALTEDEEPMYYMHSVHRPVVLVDGEDVGVLSELIPAERYNDAVAGLTRGGVRVYNFGDNDAAFDAVLTLKGKPDLVQIVGT